MNKLIVAFGIAAFILFKIAELSFGAGDSTTIAFVSFLTILLFCYMVARKQFPLAVATILVLPLLVILALISARYFSLFALPDWAIWALGLVFGVISIAQFERAHSP